MNKTTLQDRKKAYHASTDIIKDLYGSEGLTLLLKTTMQVEDIPMETWDIVGDAILGFYQTTDIPTHLQEQLSVSADDAQRIYAQLETFLTLVIEQEKNNANPKRADLKELETHLTQPPAINTLVNADTEEEGTEPAPEVPKPTPQTPTPVQGMRTMEADMSRVHGYGAYRAQFPDESGEAEHTEEVIHSASQEDILKEKPTLTDMPTYQEGEEGAK